MLSSSYYSNLIKEEKIELEKYTKQKKELESIISTIQNSFLDDVHDIQINVNKCKDNGAKGIRHDSIASQNIESINEACEKSTEADVNISSAKSNLSEELSNINIKINNCLKKIEEFGRLRDAALEEERREAEEAERRRREAEEAAAAKESAKASKGHK